MRVLFALPGLHKYDRGAEIAFISIASELAKNGIDVTLIGSGPARSGTPYHFFHAGSVSRSFFSSMPSVPILRTEYAYEELTFIPGLLWRYRPTDYDVTVSCSYPFTNWILRRPTLRGRRPAHVFVTQNGDWPAYSNAAEYRFFNCDGLVCTNPDFYERNRAHWRCALIPNGVDCARFSPGPSQRERLGLPNDTRTVLMVSALIPTKRVELGIEAVSRMTDVHLVVAGDGPSRQAVETLASKRLPGRFTLTSLPAREMPDLYRSADIFLHLAEDESFGNVFLEAMACGLPIVAPDGPRTRWIVGDTQFLAGGDAPDVIAERIDAAANAGNTTQSEEIARARTFSWQKVGEMYRNFLCELAGSSQKNV